MITLYQGIRKLLPRHGLYEIDDKLQRGRQTQSIDGVLEEAECLKWVTKKLQSRSLTFSETRALFCSAMIEFLDDSSCLSTDADICHLTIFESAVVRLPE